jgi:hypothetical protein
MTKRMTTLCLADSFKLMKLLEAEYVHKKLSDIDFAEYAATTLKLPINADHIYNRRVQLEIPATRTAATAENKKKNDKDALFEMIRMLEERVVTLEKLVVGKTERW